MQTNAFPRYDVSENTTGCCPRFKPQGWDNQELRFDKKLFVHAKTRSAMHIPWNMGSVFARVQKHIEDSGVADPETEIVLSRDTSPWEAEHYFAVTDQIDEEEMATLSGKFITRVFDGPYRKVPDFAHDMEVAATAMGKTAKQMLFFYVRLQGFWNQWRPKLRVSLAHLVGLIMRRAGGDASGAFRASFV